MINDLTIYITIGNGTAMGINDKDELVVIGSKERVITDYIAVGKLNKRTIKIMKDTLDSLAIHAKE